MGDAHQCPAQSGGQQALSKAAPIDFDLGAAVGYLQSPGRTLLGGEFFHHG